MTSSDPIDWEVEEERISARAYANGDAVGWFEELYAAGASGRVSMPWGRSDPHPLVTDWTAQQALHGDGHRAVVVGCGLGADAEHLAALGFDTLAFDVSATAVALCRQRWSGSAGRYQVADLLALPADWKQAFDVVVEVITVQSLPEPLHPTAIANISALVGPGGTLLVIAAVHDDDAPPSPTGPWPLRRDEVHAFTAGRLHPTAIEQLPDPRPPHEPRWRVAFSAPDSSA